MVYIIKDADKKRSIDKFLERAYETNKKAREESERVHKSLIEVFEKQKEVSKHSSTPKAIEEIDMNNMSGVNIPEEQKKIARETMATVTSNLKKEGINADVVNIVTDNKAQKILNLEIKKGRL